MEMDYFIKMIEQAETKRDEEINRAEAGIEDEEQQNQSILGGASQQEESEWEQIQKLPDADYLMRTVLPVLYQGMRVVDFERPAAPLESLALFLLKH
jgi:hypothetical protein